MRHLLALALVFVAMVLPATAPAAAQGDADALDLLIDLARQRPSITGPLRGELPIDLGAIHVQLARVEVRDFFVRATFYNPDPVGEHPWDIGFSFRHTGIDGGLKLIIESDGTWSFKEGMQPIVASGPVQSLATGAGEPNHIDLVAIGSEGYFAINGEYVATLDLSARDASGDIAVGVAYFAKDQHTGERITYDEFEVWPLDRTSSASESEQDADALRTLMAEATASAGDAGPFSGGLLLEDDTINFTAANVHLRDFYAHAVFANPYPASEHPWDIGLGFRDYGGERALRLTVSSDGEWFLSQGDDPFRVSGQGARLDTGAGGRNELDLVVSGDLGYLAINGEYLATLDLSASNARGDIWVSSGFFTENTRAGATTGYADFRVWSLDSPAPGSEPVEIVVWGDGEVIFDLPQEGGSGVSGLVSVVANGDGATVEVGVAGTTKDDPVGIYVGMCDALAPMPIFELEPVDAETLSSVTTLDVGFAELTNGGHALAIRASADEGAAVLACNEIPTENPEATG